MEQNLLPGIEVNKKAKRARKRNGPLVRTMTKEEAVKVLRSQKGFFSLSDEFLWRELPDQEYTFRELEGWYWRFQQRLYDASGISKVGH